MTLTDLVGPREVGGLLQLEDARVPVTATGSAHLQPVQRLLRGRSVLQHQARHQLLR